MINRRSAIVQKMIRLWAVRAFLALRINEGRIVILSSCPRSGSTWLGNILGCTPGSCVLFEPLHLKHVPAAQKAGFNWRTYRSPDESWPEGRDFLRQVFRGRIVNEWTSREMTVSQARKADLMIVKFVRANRLLPWICREFQVRATIFLIRHPCAVIASQMKSKDWSGAERPAVPPFLDGLPSFQAAIAGTRGTEEHLAAAWALDQLPVLLHDHPHPWVTVTYEELFLRPAETIERIRAACGLPIDAKAAMAKINRSSSVTYKTGISGISGWRKQLADNQVSRILQTAHALGLTFYSDDLEPNYELLNSANLGEMIRRAGRRSPPRGAALETSARTESESTGLSGIVGKAAVAKKDFVAVSGSIIAPPGRRWCGPELRDNDFYIRSAEKEADRLITHFQCSRHTRVLDIGCGQGRLPIGILRRIGEISYLGIDIDKRSIDWCKRYIERDHPSFSFMHLNLYNERYNRDGVRIDADFHFAVDPESFDVIYLFSVFSHTTEEDMRTYLKEFTRILAGEGKVFFTTFVEENVPDISINPDGYRMKCSGPLHIVRYNREYLFSILCETGFAVVQFTHATELDGQSALYLRKA